MADDYYRFIEKAHILRGEKSGVSTGWVTRWRCN